MTIFGLNGAHIHLILDHFPIVLSIISPFILGYGIFKKSDDIIKLSMYFFIFTLITIIPVYYSGGFAGMELKNVSDINLDALGKHFSIASKAFNFIIVVGIMAFISLFLGYKKPKINQKYFRYIILIIGLLASIAVSITGYYGGKIRHTELNSPNLQESVQSKTN